MHNERSCTNAKTALLQAARNPSSAALQSGTSNQPTHHASFGAQASSRCHFPLPSSPSAMLALRIASCWRALPRATWESTVDPPVPQLQPWRNFFVASSRVWSCGQSKKAGGGNRTGRATCAVSELCTHSAAHGLSSVASSLCLPKDCSAGEVQALPSLWALASHLHLFVIVRALLKIYAAATRAHCSVRCTTICSARWQPVDNEKVTGLCSKPAFSHLRGFHVSVCRQADQGWLTPRCSHGPRPRRPAGDHTASSSIISGQKSGHLLFPHSSRKWAACKTSFKGGI
jgi:hypothetical protein